MSAELIKSGKNINLVFETDTINSFGVFVIEFKNGNMIYNTLNESEAIRKFTENRKLK